ncbi:MAG: transglutaminase domain-containing protein [bacterium]
MSGKADLRSQKYDPFSIPREFEIVEDFEERCNFLAFDKSQHETATIIMNWVYSYFERWVPAINRPILDFLSQQKIFRYELPHNFLLKMGNCGLATTVFNLFCHLSGIKTRRVSFWAEPLPGCELVGHTLAEVEIDGHWLLFDPSTGISWDAALGEIVAETEKFRSCMVKPAIDEAKWQRGRLWAICNDKLYANVRKIEYLDVKAQPGMFEYESQPRVAEYLTNSSVSS